eukprot:gene1397-12017_t
MPAKDKTKEKVTDKLLYATTNDVDLIFTTEGIKSGKTISIFRPKIPKKFFLVGDYVQLSGPNDKLIGHAIVVRDPTNDNLLEEPTDYKKVWDSKSMKGGSSNKEITIWEPIPSSGYVAMGCIAVQGSKKPSVSLMRCVSETCVSGTIPSDSFWSTSSTGSPKTATFWREEKGFDVVISGLFYAVEGELLPKDYKVYNLKEKEVVAYQLPSQVSHIDLLTSQLASWIENGEYSDLTLTVGSKKIPAHSIFFEERTNIVSDVVFESRYTYEIVSLFINYLYTGAAKINHENVYEVISLTDKYGCSALRDGCFDFLIWSVDKDSVCKMMMKGKQKGFEFDATALIEKCIGFIENKAFEVIESDEFLKLDGDLVHSIVKNDKICCDELDLFNACIRWAKYQAVEQATDIKTLLEPILPFIRFPIMSTKDLLHSVRLTGLCSKKEYLEALECKAMPDLFKDNKETRFKERFKLFHGTTLLDSTMSTQLNSWIGCSKAQEWKCIYKGTKDTFAANVFHSKCDNKGPTVTVIRSTNGNIFGGYTPCKWASSGSYAYDKDSFLFSLVNSLDKMVHFKHSGSNLNSIYNSSGYGPTFGSGHDLYIVNNSNATTGSYCNSSYSYPMTPELGTGWQNGSDKSKNLFAGSYNFMTTEVEVFMKQ